MEFALFVEPQVGGSYGRLRDLAQWAERQGLDAFARSDHYMDMANSVDSTDALATLAALAVDTSTIRLVSLVSPLTFRHPSVMAKTATTIDGISGGRFTLGVGTGWMETEHEALGVELPPIGERFEMLEQGLAMITTMFKGGGSTTGDYYALNLDPVLPRASDGLKIVVGGGGPKRTPRLAGTYANEYNRFVTTEEALTDGIARVRSAATAAGRDPDAILVSLAGPGLVFEDEAAHADALAERGARRNMSGEEFGAFLDERNVPHGTPAQAADRIAKLESLGVGRYYMQEYRHLDDIDTDRLSMVFDALRS